MIGNVTDMKDVLLEKQMKRIIKEHDGFVDMLRRFLRSQYV